MSDVYVIPQSRGVAEEEDAGVEDGANYQLDMMRCLREVNVDNNTVGWCVKHWRKASPFLPFCSAV